MYLLKIADDLREDATLSSECLKTTEKVVGHSFWALSFMDPTDPAVEVTCLPNKKAEGNNFLPCFVFIVFTASFKISILSGFCFNLMFYSWDYKTKDA